MTPASDSALSRLDRLPLRPLAACLAFVFSSAVPAAGTHVVTTCNDLLSPSCTGADDGTLRQAYICGAGTIDLTQLQCSTITLHAPLSSAFGNITLLGPGRDKLTIEAGGPFRNFIHFGSASDTLTIDGLAITKGNYKNANLATQGGGCIYSSANVALKSSSVSACIVTATQFIGVGGAIYAKGDVTLTDSAVVSSTVSGIVSGLGGGIRAKTVHLTNSYMSQNRADIGGAISTGVFRSDSSTVSYNYARKGGGAYVQYSSVIINSTISGNGATDIFGGVHSQRGVSVYNSTIAFNQAASGGGGNNRLAAGLSGSYLYLQSSIIARNTAGTAPSDVAGSGTGITISGSHNLIMATGGTSNTLPDTITADPLLLGLQFNGGPTPTQAMRPDSPAINHGINFTGQPFDQRGVPRVIGSSADIGAFESDVLLRNGFDP